jgi:hypothetical protein
MKIGYLVLSALIVQTSPDVTESERISIVRDVSNLRPPAEELHNHPYWGGDEHFWAVVKHGRKALPQLVDVLTDTSRFAQTVPYCGGAYTRADVADEAIEEIVLIPTWDLIEEPYRSRTKEIGVCAKLQYLRASKRNRARYRQRVKDWLSVNEPKLIWIAEPGETPAGGYWSLPTTKPPD